MSMLYNHPLFQSGEFVFYFCTQNQGTTGHEWHLIKGVLEGSEKHTDRGFFGTPPAPMEGSGDLCSSKERSMEPSWENFEKKSSLRSNFNLLSPKCWSNYFFKDEKLFTFIINVAKSCSRFIGGAKEIFEELDTPSPPTSTHGRTNMLCIRTCVNFRTLLKIPIIWKKRAT